MDSCLLYGEIVPTLKNILCPPQKKLKIYKFIRKKIL